jgi:hypothetical protein
MSDDNTTDTEKKSKQSSLLTWIASFTALIVAIGGLAASFQSLSSFLLPSKPKPPIASQCSTNSQKSPIIVNATSRQGSCFQNTHFFTQTYEFFADGEWSHHPNTTNDAGGHPNLKYATSNYRLPNYPEGALIVRRDDEKYEFIGTETELELKRGEKVFFTINDDTTEGSEFDRFRDNKGSLKVDWNCKTCE